MAGINTSAKEFKDSLVNLVNSSKLPVTFVRIVMESVLLEVRELEKKALEQERTLEMIENTIQTIDESTD